MDEEVAELQANLNAYTTLLRDAGADPRIILLADGGVCIPPPLGAASCGAGADQNLPGYRHVTNAVQSTNALDVIIDSYAQYSDSLRAGALKSLMVISDDDSDVSASSFAQAFLALDPANHAGFVLDAIAAASDPEGCIGLSCPVGNACCVLNVACMPRAAAEGAVYKSLATQTGGLFVDLCLQDFDPLFNALATALVARATRCSFAAPNQPEDTLSLRLLPSAGAAETLPYRASVNDCAAASGWFRAAVDAPLELCPASCDVLKQNVTTAVEILGGCG